MSKLQHYAVTKDGEVYTYAIKTPAQQVAREQGGFYATDTDLSGIPTEVLVTLHNVIRPEKPVKRFSDRKTAEKRMMGVLEVLGKPGPAPTGEVPPDNGTTETTSTSTSDEDSDMASATKKGRKRASKKTTTTAAKKTNGNGTGGRRASYADRIIHKVTETNPAREGSKRFDAWKAIRDGSSYEDYIKKGGNAFDLRFFVEKGHIKLK